MNNTILTVEEITVLLNFPKRASDWVSIWQATRTITLRSCTGCRAIIPIDGIETALTTADLETEQPKTQELETQKPLSEPDSDAEIAALRITLECDEFYISFYDDVPELKNQLTYYFTGRNPTKGCWDIPARYLEQLTKET